jgi:hypothetical protein
MRVVELTQEHYNKGPPNYEGSVHVRMADIKHYKNSKRKQFGKMNLGLLFLWPVREHYTGLSSQEILSGITLSVTV